MKRAKVSVHRDIENSAIVITHVSERGRASMQEDTCPKKPMPNSVSTVGVRACVYLRVCVRVPASVCVCGPVSVCTVLSRRRIVFRPHPARARSVHSLQLQAKSRYARRHQLREARHRAVGSMAKFEADPDYHVTILPSCFKRVAHSTKKTKQTLGQFGRLASRWWPSATSVGHVRAGPPASYWENRPSAEATSGIMVKRPGNAVSTNTRN